MVGELSDEYEFDKSSSSESVEEDKGPKKKKQFKPKCPVWNPKRDIFTFVPELYQKFKDTKQLRDCLTGYAVKKDLGIYFDRISKDLLLAKCQQKKCDWRLWAVKMTYEDSVQITSLNTDAQ